MEVLAAACAEAGFFDEAVRHQTMALEDPVWERVDRTDEFNRRLDLYKNKKPYRSLA